MRAMPATPLPPPSGAVAATDPLDEGTIEVLVQRFYAEARRDPVLGPVFAQAVPDDDWPGHLEKICAFWSSVMLGSRRYRGQPLPAHLGIPGLTGHHFARWLQLFTRAAAETCTPGVAAVFVDRAERIARSLQLALAVHRSRSEGPGPVRPGALSTQRGRDASCEPVGT